MTRGMTQKPCPGCEQEGWRPTNGVCSICRTLLQLGREAQAISERDTTRKVYRVPWRAHAFPYYGGTPELRALRERVAAMLYAVGKKADISQIADHLFSHQRRPISDDTELYVLPVAFAEAVVALDLAIDAAIRKTYQEGKAEGRNLLKQLANGDLAPSTVNDWTINGKG